MLAGDTERWTQKCHKTQRFPGQQQEGIGGTNLCPLCSLPAAHAMSVLALQMGKQGCPTPVLGCVEDERVCLSGLHTIAVAVANGNVCKTPAVRCVRCTDLAAKGLNGLLYGLRAMAEA